MTKPRLDRAKGLKRGDVVLTPVHGDSSPNTGDRLSSSPAATFVHDKGRRPTKEDWKKQTSFGVRGKDSAKEMEELCKFLGVQLNDGLGIPADLWEAHKPLNSRPASPMSKPAMKWEFLSPDSGGSESGKDAKAEVKAQVPAEDGGGGRAVKDSLPRAVTLPPLLIESSHTGVEDVSVQESAKSPSQRSILWHGRSPPCWRKGELLGSGSFGTVYEGVGNNGSFFAVKEVSLLDEGKQAKQSILQLQQEIALLSELEHENIVQYLGTESTGDKLYIFLELVSKGSLASVYKKYPMVEEQVCAYTQQILHGLKYLHDRNIIHRDIKCANLLVDVSGVVKLADFGMAKEIDKLDKLKSCKGSAYWMAPEVIDATKTYGIAADIWSLGCTVLEMVTGKPPLSDLEWQAVLWRVGHGEAPPIPENMSPDLKDFIKQCLEVDVNKRPTVDMLLTHPLVWRWESSFGSKGSPLGQLSL
ncbi:unnamed protein product [Sphagnum compactum]